MGRRWYGIHEVSYPDSLSGALTVTLDGRFEWKFDIAAWRPVYLGVNQDVAYLWSARELIVLPRRGSDEPIALRVDDDDVVMVFRLDDGWVLVCESSIRRVLGREETARWDLPDVVDHAGWEDGVLSLRDQRGTEVQLKVDGPALVLAAS